MSQPATSEREPISLETTNPEIIDREIIDPEFIKPEDRKGDEGRGPFTLRSLWLWLLPWGLFVRLCLTTIAPNHFWWHVRTGQLILQSCAIPMIDLFTYTQLGA